MNISSFGEDEDGELYVVDLNGTVRRIGPPLSCGYALTPTERAIDAAGGPGAFTVEVEAGCGWAAVHADPWIHIRSGARGIGAGVVGYQVDQNSSGVARTGTIRIAGLTFTIRQGAQSP